MATTTFFGCSKDNDDKVTDEPTLVGIWKMASRTLNGEPDPLDECEDKMKFAFTETQLTSYTYEGENCEIEEVLVYDFTLDGDKLILRSEDLTAEYTVRKLTKTTLELSYRFEGSVYVATFTRQ